MSSKLSDAPCNKCGYNGPNYYQPSTHKCAEPTAQSSGEVEDAFSVLLGFVMDGPIIDVVETLRAHIAALEAENKRLREALQFYADSSNYETRWTHSMFECQDCGSGSIIDDDCGEIAKTALSQADGKDGE